MSASGTKGVLRVTRREFIADPLGCELVAQAATTEAEIEACFATLVRAGASALVVQNDPFFDSQRHQIVALSFTYRIAFSHREFPADGGLMSYGASLSDTYRQVGVYAGKVLHGAKPDDLRFCGRQGSKWSST